MTSVRARATQAYHAAMRRYPVIGAVRTSRLLFGNERPLRMNLQFRRYWRKCRRAYPGPRAAWTDDALRATRALRERGYYVFPPSDPAFARTLARRVQDLVEAGHTLVTPGIEEWMIEVTQCMTRVPDIIRFLRPEVTAVLEAYFRSHFKVYSAEIYRLVPTTDRMQASGLWHTDNYPPGFSRP